MMNNYKIFGLIMSLISNDYPPKVSKDFSQKVMKRLSLGETFHKNTSTNNYLNAAASIFFAVVTAYVLISFERTETNVVSVDTIENTTGDSDLIKRVKDDPVCVSIETDSKEYNESCK